MKWQIPVIMLVLLFLYFGGCQNVVNEDDLGLQDSITDTTDTTDTIPDDTTKPVITFLNPVDSSVFSIVDSVVYVSWTKPVDSTELVGLELYYDSVFFKSIKESMYNTGSYTWDIYKKYANGDSYQLRLFKCEDSSTIVFSEKFSITGSFNGDEYEIDDIYEQAKLITPGELQKRTFFSGNSDWVKYAVTEGDTFTFKLYTDYRTSVDTKVASEVAAGTDGVDWSQSYNFKRVTTGLTDTIYHCIRISPYKALPDDYTENPKRHTYYASLSTSSSNDTAIFIMPYEGDTYVAGDTLNVRLINCSNTITLYRDDSVVTTITLSGSKYDLTIPNGMVTSDNYYFTSTKSDDSTTIVKSGTFAISASGVDDIYENNNTESSATSFDTTIGKMSANLTALDIDYYSLSINKDEYYSVHLTTSGEPIKIELYKQGENTPLFSKEAQSYDSTLLLDFTALFSGTAYLKVFQKQYSTTESVQINYDISLNHLESFDSLQVSVDTGIPVYNALDTMKIHYLNKSNRSAVLEIFRDDTLLGEISEYNNIIDSGTYNWIVPYTPVTSSKYRISIKIDDNDIRAFSDLVSMNGFTENDSFEENNSFETAVFIDSFNTAINARIFGIEYDWFAFPIDSGYSYAPLVSYGVSWRLYHPDGLVDSWDDEYTSYRYDTLWVNVNTYDVFGRDYSLIISKFPIDGLPVEIQSPLGGEVYDLGDSLKIAVIAQKISSVNVDLMLNDSAIEDIDYIKTTGEPRYWIIPDHLSYSDSYYIKVQDDTIVSYSNTFTINGIKPDSYEPNDSVQYAAPLDLSTLPFEGNGTFEVGDVDWYKINLIKDSTYTFTFNSSEDSIFTEVQLFKGDETDFFVGEFRILVDDDLGYIGTVDFTPDSTGEFLLYFDPWRDTYCGGYTFSIK